MAYRDLREYLQTLEAKGKLRRVAKEVDKDWELACITRWVLQAVPEESRYGLLFERIKGYDMPLAACVFGASRQVYAIAMETEPDQIYEKWIKVLKSSCHYAEVDTGPCKENILRGDEVDLFRFPVPIWTPGKDAGPYFTCTSTITVDPETGSHNIGNYRMQLRSKNQVGVQIFDNQHIGMHFQRWARGGRPMPIAVAIGVDPAIGLAATAKVPYGMDEFDVASAIRGEPVETVKAELSDLRVPATAEIVLEGEVPLDEEPMEGPFGEYMGYMGLPGPKRVINVRAITHRRTPIFQSYVSQMPPSESLVLQQQAHGAAMYKHLVYDLGLEGIRDVLYTSASARAHLIIQMRPQFPGHARKVMLVAQGLMGANSPKIVTVVDEDIDIRDPFLLEWAMASRVDPAKDIVILHDTETTQLDPSTTLEILPEGTSKRLIERLTGSKLLIDATIKKTYPAISLPPKDLMDRALESWEETGLPPIQVPDRTRRLLEKHPGSGLYIEPYQ